MPFRQHHPSPGMLKIMMKCFPKSNINHFMNSPFKVSLRVLLHSRVIKSQRKGLRSLSAPPMKQEITPVTSYPNPTWPCLMVCCHFSLFDFTEDSTRLFLWPFGLHSPGVYATVLLGVRARITPSFPHPAFCPLQ